MDTLCSVGFSADVHSQVVAVLTHLVEWKLLHNCVAKTEILFRRSTEKQFFVFMAAAAASANSYQIRTTCFTPGCWDFS